MTISKGGRRKGARERKEPIPEFHSQEEEAAFWDTHDMADHWDEFKPVTTAFAKNLSGAITVRLDPDTLQELRAQAGRKGIGPTTLARMWIMERLHNTSALG